MDYAFSLVLEFVIVKGDIKPQKEANILNNKGTDYNTNKFQKLNDASFDESIDET